VADFHLNYSGDLRECCWWSLSTEIVLGFPVCNFEHLRQYLLLGRVRLINAVVVQMRCFVKLLPGLFVLIGPQVPNCSSCWPRYICLVPMHLPFSAFWKLIALVYLLQEVCDVFLEVDCLGVSLAGGLRCLLGGRMISILVGWRRIFFDFFD
jgi:hypothetical protein